MAGSTSFMSPSGRMSCSFFKKKKKAEAKDIPAATQIFTPNWIVKYHTQNTLGKLWLEKKPDSELRQNMKYLVEAEDTHEGVWRAYL